MMTRRIRWLMTLLLMGAEARAQTSAPGPQKIFPAELGVAPSPASAAPEEPGSAAPDSEPAPAAQDQQPRVEIVPPTPLIVPHSGGTRRFRVTNTGKADLVVYAIEPR